MTCNHSRDKLSALGLDVIWCSVCGSIQENGEWKLSQQEQSLRAAGRVWENPTECFEEPTLVGAIKVLLPSNTNPVALAHILKGARLSLTINRRWLFLDELIVNMMEDWGFALNQSLLLLPGMLVEISFDPPDFGWECRWLVRRIDPAKAIDFLSRQQQLALFGAVALR